MKIVTWNVNSVVARTERLLAWLERNQPDVLCLQELKAVDERFPDAPVRALGYQPVLFGQPTYNGVAILARGETPLDVKRGFDDGVVDPMARLISARVFGTTVICAYVPNGQSVGSDKYEYKLKWLERLLAYLETHHDPKEPLVLCGDFNCAPDARDVAKPELHEGGVLVDEKVRAAVRALERWGLVEVFRKHHEEAGYYSWWDYRMLGFAKGNGLRIDLVFATEELANRSTGASIDRNERKGKKPSDHVPVVVEFEG